MLPELVAVGIVGGIVLLILAFAASIVFGVLRAVREGDRKAARLREKAVAVATPGPDGSFVLQFPSPGPELGVWARQEVLQRGGDEDDRVRVRIEVRANGVELTSGGFRLGEDTSSPLAGPVREIAYRSRPEGLGERITSTVALAPVSSAAPGTRIEIRGTVTPSEGVTIRKFEVFATAERP